MALRERQRIPKDTMDGDPTFSIVDDSPSIILIYAGGYDIICVPRLPFFTGEQFVRYVFQMYELTGSFYVAGWKPLNLSKELYRQGISLFSTSFVFHESAKGITLDHWGGNIIKQKREDDEDDILIPLKNPKDNSTRE
jgi:hypothetical protein